jgi:hypothetical protein
MLGDLMDKLLVIVFSYAWFGVEVYNQIQQRKRRDSTASPDRGSLVFLYVCIAIGGRLLRPGDQDGRDDPDLAVRGALGWAGRPSRHALWSQ